MGALTHPAVRKMLAFGSGVGIEFGPGHLNVMIVRVRPQGVTVVGEFRIENYLERPAADWGREYAKFLARHEAEPYAALALLAREDVVLRSLTLPGLKSEETDSAIRLQLDALHPWGEGEEVISDWRRLGEGGQVAVAIARREVVDRVITLMAEAGVKLAGLTFAASAIYCASRVYSGRAALPRLALFPASATGGEAVEVYGESETRPLFSACFDLDSQRALRLSAAEMRMDAPEVAASVMDLLPRAARTGSSESPDAGGEDGSTGAACRIYAAALTAASPHLSDPLNLLPQELRRGVSKAMYIPTAALALLLGVAATGLLAENSVLDQRHMDRLRAELSRLEPVARKMDAIDRRTAAMGERIQRVDSFRKRPKADLDVLLEVNRLLPPPAFVQQLVIDDANVILAGEAEQAESLLKALDASPLFYGAEFTAPLSRGQAGEMFRIRMKREAGR